MTAVLRVLQEMFAQRTQVERPRGSWLRLFSGPRDAALQMSTRSRDVLFVLLGVAGLVLERRYSGPYHAAVHSYGGNVAASFAVYFLARRLPFRAAFPRALAAGVAIVVVELFELLNGFGVMTNVYDPVDFAANTIGIALALTVDAVTDRGKGRAS